MIPTIKATQRRVEKSILKKKNVVGVGIGKKNGTGPLCLIVSVRVKEGVDKLKKKDLIPSKIDGITTDVIQTSDFVLLEEQERITKQRPAFPGISIGHKDITAGTFGCLLKDAEGDSFILSNNHVLANVNQGELGDEIIQPGAHDGGSVNGDDVVGFLEDYVPIEMDGESPGPEPPPIPDCSIANGVAAVLNYGAKVIGSRFRLEVTPLANDNYFDAAIAIPSVTVRPEILGIGAPTGAGVVTVDTPVKKSGRTTGLTEGVVTQMNATIRVQMGENRVATFHDQIVSDVGSAGGDSGSAVLNNNDEVVGLLFAGGQGVTIINPIQPILQAFNLTIL